MKIIKPSVEIIDALNEGEILQKIERCGRVCYKSEDKTAPGSAARFVKSLIARGHESVLEHVSFTVRFICDRGVSHEIVRHRMASYSQESTRYCNYGDGLTFVVPPWVVPDGWLNVMAAAEHQYTRMLSDGHTPEQARSVLPNSLKTELVMTANLREWRHFFRLRLAPAAHPQMREVAGLLFDQVSHKLPSIFADIVPEADQ